MKRHQLDIDNIVKEYTGGRGILPIAKDRGVRTTTIRALLVASGLEIRQQSRSVDDAAIVSAYVAGESVLALAGRFGVSRPCIITRLGRAGIPLRGGSEANRVSASRATPEARQRRTEACHKAVKGVRHSLEQRIKMATAWQQALTHVSPQETALCSMLAARGVHCIQQQAIGPYNCDLGAFPVAVEVFGGHWHFSGAHLARAPRRIRYLLDAGWHVLMVLVTKHWPIAPEVADYVAAYVQEARGNPTAPREYRVIRGAGNTLAFGSADDNHISIEPSTRLGREPTTGRYKSVAG
jgi:hypothetical protein